jgi:uncharacterized protein (DUF1015 family)
MSHVVNEVKPFQALHYNPLVIDNIGLCLSQPYDVISPTEQDGYYAQHDYNVIRLILNKIEESDGPTNNRYTRANEFLQNWKKESILICSEHPSFFVYEQSFNLPGIGWKKLKGFIGLVRLADYEEGRILPHEKVLKKPVEDRITLTTTTDTQFEYIWGLYPDTTFEIDRILDRHEEIAALVDYKDPKTGVRHRLHRLKDPAHCRSIETVMRRNKIYIADGHHRYQTMLNVRDAMRKKYPKAGRNAPWEFIMMFLVNTLHDGLIILPTHRLLYGLDESALNKLKRELPDYFTEMRFPFGTNDEAAVRSRWLGALAAAPNPAFGLALKGDSAYFLLALKEIDAYKKLITEKATDAWKLLDVNVLNILILRKMLGITEEMMSLQSNVEYVKDTALALKRVTSGEMQAAFILKPTPLSAVVSVADAGEKMPRKSTFFFPKPLSGLVFYEMS